MKINRFAILLLISGLGCTRQDDRGQDVKHACVTSPCEGEAFMRKLNIPNGGNLPQWKRTPLHADEANSLNAAMANTQTTGAEDKLHVHADAVGGRLVFKGERDHDEHVSGNEPELSLGDQNPATKSKPVKVIATPAALKLMQERAQAAQ